MSVGFGCQKFTWYLLLVWIRQEDVITLYSVEFRPACMCVSMNLCAAFILETWRADRKGWHTASVCNSSACVCVCLRGDVHVCAFECQSRQTPHLFVVAEVCVIFTGGFSKLTGSLVLVLVQLVLFMGADGVGALAQQQNNDAVVCSPLQQYHHSLPAAPWAESGGNKCTENCFLGACVPLLKWNALN